MSGSNEAYEANQAYQATAPQQAQPQAQALPTMPAPAAPPAPTYRAQQDNTLVPFDKPVFVGDSAGAPKPAKPTGMLRQVADNAWKSTMDMGSGVLGAVSFATRQITNDPEMTAYVATQRAALDDHIQNFVSNLPVDEQNAMHSSIMGGGENGPGTVGWKNYAAATVGSLIPQLILTLLPGGLVGKAVTKVVGEGIAAGVARTATTAGAFGTLQAGDAYNALVDQVDKSTPADWKDSAPMQHLLSTGMSFNDAKSTIVGQVAKPMVAMQFGLGAAAGAGAGSLLTGGAAGAAGRGLMARAGIGAAEGAVTLGAQSGGGEAVQQNAQMQAGLRQEFDPSAMAHAYALGTLSGAALGAAGGMMHSGQHAPAPDVPAETTQVDGATHVAGPTHTSVEDPAVGAALNTQLGLDLTQASPGTVAGSPQGELFRSAAEANPGPAADTATATPAPGAAPATAAAAGPTTVAGQGSLAEDVMNPPGSRPAPAVAPAVVRPSDGMKVAELRDALKTMPNQDPKAIARMSRTDLAAAYDKADSDAKSSPQVTPTAAEPQGDVDAQMAAIADPNNPKDTMFVTKGGPLPKAAEGVYQSHRPEGALFSTDPKKTRAFSQAPTITEHGIAGLLGHAETKDQLGPDAVVVQGKDAAGNVVHEQVVSPERAPEVIEKAHAEAPDGVVRTVTPDQAVERRRQTLVDEAEQIGKPTVGDELKAKTAARRVRNPGRMKAPGERIKGEGVSVGAEEGKTTEPVEPRDKTAVLNDVAKAMDEGAKKIVPLQKGADVGPILDRIVKELHAKLKDAKTEGDIHEAIAKWGRSDNTSPIPGTKTRRLEIADKVMQLLTGKTVDEFSGRRAMGSDIRAAMREDMSGSDKRVGAKTEAAGEDAEAKVFKDADDTAGEATTVGPAQTSYEANDKKLPEKHGDKLPAVLDRVLQGTMDVHEAQAEIGTQKPGPGRPREHGDFGAYLEHVIERGQDPKAVDDLVAKMVAHDTNKYPTPQAKKAAGDRLNLELKHTDPEQLDKLRDLLAQLHDPVKAEVDAAPPTRRDMIDTTPGRSMAHTLSDPRVTRDLDRLATDKDIHGLHGYLDAIIHNAVLQSDQPSAVWLARIIRGRVPHLRVIPTPRAVEAFGEKAFYAPDGALGYYMEPHANHGEAFIGIDPSSKDKITTILHESMHAITSKYLDSLHPTDRDARALQVIHDELRSAMVQHIADLPEGTFSRIDYALSNVHELHTMLMTDPRVQSFAAQHIPSEGFKQDMRQLGYGDPALKGSKSIWSYFTNWVKNALGIKNVAGEGRASFLDHIMRPLQDVTDSASKANKRDQPWSFAQNLEASLHARPDFDKALDAIDAKGLSDKGLRAMLATKTLDGMVSKYKDLVPHIVDYRDASEAWTARSKAFHDSYDDKVRDLTGRFGGPERDKLANLMNDATLANVRLGPSADNSHLKGADAARVAPLQARYDALSTKAQQTYQDARALHSAMDKEERAARLSGLVKTVIPDATDAEKKAITKAAKSRASLDKFLADPDNSDIANAFGSRWQDARALVKGIADLHSRGFVQGDYFPLRRFGDYVVNYGAKENEDYGVEMFDKRSDADNRRAELLKADPTQRVSPVMDKRVSKMRDMLPASTVVDELTAAMKKNPALADKVGQIQDMANSILLQHATRSDTARNALRRRGVKGASTDIERVTAADFLASASRVGYLEHGPDRYKALSDMRQHADSLKGDGEQIRASSVVHELEKRMPSGDDNSGMLKGFARQATKLGYVQSLMSFSHMFTATMEAHTNSIPLMAARHGLTRTGFQLAKALKDVSPVLGKGAVNSIKAMTKGLKASDWNLSTYVRDKLIAGGANKTHMDYLTNQLNNAGLIDHTFTRELQRMANPGHDITRGVWGKFMDMNGAGAHAVDVANKMAIAKAAFDLEMRKTGDYKAASRYAVDTARQAMPNYNTTNKSRISTDKGALGGFAGPLTQFKQYGLHMYSMMGALLNTSLHGATKAEKWEARKAFAGILATHAMTAGVLTLIGDPLRWIGGAYDFVTGADKPHEYENDVRGWMSDTFGPEAGELMARGLPHAIGIDVHRRVGLSNLLELPEIKSFDKQGFGEAVATAMTGAAGEDAAAMAGGVAKMLHGDIVGGLKDVVPRVIRDAMKASDLSSKGVVDSKGKTILPPSKLSGGDIAAQAIGFQPSRVSEFREGRFAVQEAQGEAKTARSKLMSDWLSADPDDRTQVMNEIRQFNHTHQGETISTGQLLQAKERERKAAKLPTNSFGVKMTPAQSREMTPAGRFANVG